MRQNCLPQTVYLASSTQMISVAIAAIVQAWASHIRDAHSSLPQSSVGVKPAIPIPCRQRTPTGLGQRCRRPQLRVLSGSSRQSPPPTSSRWRPWNCSTVARWLTLTKIMSGSSVRISS